MCCAWHTWIDMIDRMKPETWKMPEVKPTTSNQLTMHCTTKGTPFGNHSIPKGQRDHHWHNPWPALPCPTHQTIPVKHPGPKDIDHHHALNPNRSWFQIKGWGRSTYTNRRCELRPWKRVWLLRMLLVYVTSKAIEDDILVKQNLRFVTLKTTWQLILLGNAGTSSHTSSRLWSTFKRITREFIWQICRVFPKSGQKCDETKSIQQKETDKVRMHAWLARDAVSASFNLWPPWLS